MAKRTEIKGGNKRRVQVRKAVPGGFSAAKRQVFLDHLAACCNVARAAQAAGVGVSTVYDARRRDPAFAQAWDEAIEAGYATLEALLIERAALGKAPGGGGGYTPGDTPVPGPETIDTWLALDLLRLRRAPKAPRKAGGAPLRRESEKGLDEAILAKLDVLNRRMKLERGSKKGALRPAASTSSAAREDERGGAATQDERPK